MPALCVIVLQLRRFLSLPRWPDHGARLEHEGHGVDDVAWLARIHCTGLGERRRVRAVPAEAVVQRRTARHEAASLGVVFAVDQAHELTRDVAVKPGRAER